MQYSALRNFFYFVYTSVVFQSWPAWPDKQLDRISCALLWAHLKLMIHRFTYRIKTNNALWTTFSSIRDFPHLAGLKLRFLQALSVFFKFFTVTEGVERLGICSCTYSRQLEFFGRFFQKENLDSFVWLNQVLYFSGSWWTKTRVTFDETHAHPLNMNKPFQIVEIYW